VTLGLVVAALFAGLICAVSHWAGEILSHGRLARLWRYVLGVGAMGLAFGAWCWQAGHWEALWAWLVIAVGAGLGTMLAYLVDHVAGLERQARLLEGQVGNGEPAARRAGFRGE
jgi:hypothetical protein